MYIHTYIINQITFTPAKETAGVKLIQVGSPGKYPVNQNFGVSVA
jgi:hypothetical protein